MRENSILAASALSPTSYDVPMRLHSSQNIDAVNVRPAITAIGTLNMCMSIASCVLD
jgi:hypothetical protein